MRVGLIGLLFPLAACASMEPSPVVAAAATEAVDASAAIPTARREPNSPPNATVRIADGPEAKQVCWTEKVTGTLGRKQTVCRDARTERDAALLRKDFKDFQDRAGSTQPQTLGGAGG